VAYFLGHPVYQRK